MMTPTRIKAIGISFFLLGAGVSYFYDARAISYLSLMSVGLQLVMFWALERAAKMDERYNERNKP